MIAFIRGVLVEKRPNTVFIECNGIGYEVMAPLTVVEKLPPEGETIFLLTQFVVREESQTLYGFLNESERTLFCRLIKVSGVGAKTALAMMSALTTDSLLAALSTEDIGRLSAVPGIGRKTAERLIVDFRGSSLLLETAAFSVDNDAEQALAALGYKKSEIGKALSQLPAVTNEDTASRVRTALRVLSRH